MAVPLLIAAIAAATAFLFIAITMAGRRRRRRKRRGVAAKVEEEEEEGWGVDNIMDLVWIGKGGAKVGIGNLITNNQRNC